MGSVEERWLKMKFTGEFLKKLLFPPIVLSTKHFLNDYCVIEPQSSKQDSLCVRSSENSLESCGEDCSTAG